MGDHLGLSIDSDLRQVPIAADGVRAFCRHRLPPADIDAVELAVVEAVNNVIKHGYGNRLGNEIVVNLDADPNCIMIEILDHAPPLSPTQVRAMGAAIDFDATDRAQLPEGGFGLALIGMSVDEVNYRTDRSGNTLRLVKRRKGACLDS